MVLNALGQYNAAKNLSRPLAGYCRGISSILTDHLLHRARGIVFGHLPNFRMRPEKLFALRKRNGMGIDIADVLQSNAGYANNRMLDVTHGFGNDEQLMLIEQIEIEMNRSCQGILYGR